MGWEQRSAYDYHVLFAPLGALRAIDARERETQAPLLRHRYTMQHPPGFRRTVRYADLLLMAYGFPWTDCATFADTKLPIELPANRPSRQAERK